MASTGVDKSGRRALGMRWQAGNSAMGVVSEHLVGLIAKQVEDKFVVVWYDPGADYPSVAKRLEIPGATIARYEGSFLKLRREIDTLLCGLEPPKLVVYVPV